MSNTLRSKTRNQALDILRAVAVFLVLLRHAYVYADPKTHVTPLAAFFRRGGWVGVDLFFVLSGFLIAQLLFKEHKKFGDISYKTFLIRRGFKIYPPYYGMAVITTLILCAWTPFTLGQILLWSFPWLFYLQDYVQTPLTFIWGHTWSLAVEEQFYLVLPLLLILLARTGKTREDPFKSIPTIFVLVSVACLAMRMTNAATAYDGLIHLAPFHIRVDSLFAGVFISYLYHYRPLIVIDVVKRFRYALLCVGLVLVLPPFLLEITESSFMYTFGYTLLYVGNALITMTAVVSERTGTGWLANTAGYVGSRSYSIYLWHFPIAWLIHQPEAHLSWIPLSLFFSVFLVASILFGIIISNIVEMPMLNVRDKLYPSRST